MKSIMGLKLGMTSIYNEQEELVGVTVLQCGPCHVVQKKTEDSDGYNAVQLGFLPDYQPNKPKLGHCGGEKAYQYLREFRLTEEEIEKISEEDVVNVSEFAKGDLVNIKGFSKGRGFAGVIKRYGFRRQPVTHGQSDRTRAPGSAGAGTDPGRVLKGKRMPGRMGNVKVCMRNLEIVDIDEDKNILYIKGSVPGPKDKLVLISAVT